jgi:hypothetical protein
MTTSEIALIVSTAAFVVAAVNVSISYAAFRRSHIGRLLVTSHHQLSTEELYFSIVNTGSRPLMLEGLRLGYGHAPDFMVAFVDLLKLFGTASLTVGEKRDLHLPVSDLRSCAQSAQVRQGRYRRLWVRAKIAGGAVVDHLVYVDLNLIASDVPPSAAQFIATDVLMGFTPLAPELIRVNQDR